MWFGCWCCTTPFTSEVRKLGSTIPPQFQYDHVYYHKISNMWWVVPREFQETTHQSNYGFVYFMRHKRLWLWLIVSLNFSKRNTFVDIHDCDSFQKAKNTTTLTKWGHSNSSFLDGYDRRIRRKQIIKSPCSAAQGYTNVRHKKILSILSKRLAGLVGESRNICFQSPRVAVTIFWFPHHISTTTTTTTQGQRITFYHEDHRYSTCSIELGTRWKCHYDDY